MTGIEVVRTGSESGKSPRHEYRVTAEYEGDGHPYRLVSFEPRVGSTAVLRDDPEDRATRTIRRSIDSGSGEA